MIQTTLRDYLQNTEDALSAGHINEALEHCQYVLSYFPESLEAQRLLGEIYMAQGHLDAAQQTFDWVLTNDPENVIAYCNRALISERMEDLETALDCYQQAYELSRGNSQIRQEFNLLSARIGQQDFMFSRAGLARLYMRGDLLPQAIQEWEVVLATAPDRLDARIGLLETCWREGAYEQVEQLANQILEEIPGCLKAILLLAYTISSKNPARARELVQRAEALDPEMVMAQELFSDLIASQPDNPFLALIKKNPVQLVTTDAQDAEPISTILPTESTPANTLSSASNASSAEPIFGWDSPDLVVPSAPEQQPADAHLQNAQGADLWPPFGSPLEGWSQNETGADSWQSQLGIGQELGSGNGLHQVSKETALPTPPAWLDSLTRQERLQADETRLAADASTAIDSQQRQEDRPTLDASEPASNTSRQTEPDKKPASPEQDVAPPFLFAAEESDIDMGWPEWLKSLGAEEMEKSASSEPEEAVAGTLEQAESATWTVKAAPSDPLPEPQPVAHLDQQPSPAYWSEPDSQETQNKPANPWLEQLSHASDPVPEPVNPWLEQLSHASDAQPEPVNPWLSQLTHTPQPVYADPWTMPATSMQQVEAINPWLGQLAPPVAPQPDVDQHVFTTLENLEYGLRSQGFVPLEPGALSSIAQETQSQEPLLAALTQSGRFEQPAAPSQVDMPELAAPTIMPATQSVEPLWPATPAPAPERVTLPAYRADTVLDSELETTMKRPAFRLQPMQQRSASAQPTEQPLFSGNEPANGTTLPRPADGNLSYRERLLRGYQCQLAGAYDDAMHEYRIIIRNAPDLLGDVISNTRALLKLAPRYAIGYRVLGDAYMRQGEYLQAMEAYNKALTMAKRAKGQSN